MRVSLRDVGKEAGVSGATVSRVLNGVEARIPAATQARIRRIATEMGYRPSRAARALATGRTMTVALWLPDLRAPAHAEAADGMRREAQTHGYDLMIGGADAGEGEGIDGARLAEWPVDGIFAVDVGGRTVSGLNAGLLGGKPLVCLGDGGPIEADAVRVEFGQAAREATRHLAQSGCRRIVFVSPRGPHVRGDARQDGYREALAEAGLGPEYLLVPDGEDPRPAAYRAVGDALDRHARPDALLCLSDDLAFGAARALRERGLRVPQDVALVGCDGTDGGLYLDPPLSTLARPLSEICALAWDLLNRRLADPSRPLQQIGVPARLVLRESSRR